jgi:hypothetical protein
VTKDGGCSIDGGVKGGGGASTPEFRTSGHSAVIGACGSLSAISSDRAYYVARER